MAEFQQACNGLANGLNQTGNAPAKIEYSNRCPTPAQGSCRNFMNSGMDAFYYQRTGRPEHEAVNWPDAIARASDRIRALEETAVAVDAARHDARWAEALALFERDELDAAVHCLAGSSERDAQLLRAIVHLQRGNLDAVMQLAPVDAESHYVRGLAAEVHGELDAAVMHHTAATRLDPTFAMPHLQLGLLSRRAADLPAARRALADALALLERETAERVVLFGGGFRKDALVALCRAELARVEAA